MISINQIKNSYGTETALMILCCRVCLNTAALNELELFVSANTIDWKQLAYLSGVHKIRPIVYKAIFEVQIPADVKILLSTEHAGLIRLSWKQAIETERIITLFTQHHIEVVPYKGTAFSKQFYHDFVSRESNDIDLIIHPKDLSLAAQILKEDGYIPEIDDVYHYLGTRYSDYYKDYSLNKFNGAHRTYHLELHWAIAENYYNVVSEVNSFLYTHIEQTVFVRARIKMLDPVAHFSAVLIHHAVKDGFTSLKNLVDVSYAIQHPDIQTQGKLLNKTFTKLKLQKVLNLGSGLSQQLLGVKLNQLTHREVPEPAMQHFIDNICSGCLLLTDNKLQGSVKNAILLQESTLKRLQLFYHIAKYRFIPATTDFRLLKLPQPLFFLYYLIKPFRSIIKRFSADEEKRRLTPES